jgi:hypothetical protein
MTSDIDYKTLNLLSDAFELGYKKCLEDDGKRKIFLSEREAFRQFGTGIVTNWVSKGLIEPDQDGENTSKKRYDRMKLEILAKSSNRGEFKPNKKHKPLKK